MSKYLWQTKYYRSVSALIFGLVLVATLVLPALALAQNAPNGEEEGEAGGRQWEFIVCGEATDNCDFAKLKELVNVVIDFVIFGLAMPLAVIGIVYAGALYIYYADNSSKRSEATGIFKNIVYGLVLMLAAYIIVKALVLGLIAGNTNSVSSALRDIFK